jgi:PKD repeat protein
MVSMSMRRIARLTVLLSAAALVGAGCTVNEVDAPPLMGPSELALSVTLTADPDIVPEDGASQSVIGIFARDENGQPKPNVQVVVTTDLGRLSASTVSTGSNGRVNVTFTAPVTQFPGFDAGNVATVAVTPISNNFANAISRRVFIRLVPPAVIQIPGAPVAAFSFGPQSPKVGDRVLFDASASFDPNGTIVSYEWDFGDGDVHGFGRNQDHDYTAPGTYFVTLTVTDDSGLKGTVTRAIVVTET